MDLTLNTSYFKFYYKAKNKTLVVTDLPKNQKYELSPTITDKLLKAVFKYDSINHNFPLGLLDKDANTSFELDTNVIRIKQGDELEVELGVKEIAALKNIYQIINL